MSWKDGTAPNSWSNLDKDAIVAQKDFKAVQTYAAQPGKLDSDSPTDFFLNLMLGEICNPKNYPMEFHCHAGVGRTGIAQALVFYTLYHKPMAEAIQIADSTGAKLLDSQKKFLLNEIEKRHDINEVAATCAEIKLGKKIEKETAIATLGCPSTIEPPEELVERPALMKNTKKSNKGNKVKEKALETNSDSAD